MANNIYSFALCREIRAEERRAPGQELFAERGWEGIQSPPSQSLTCAQVHAGRGAYPCQPSTSCCVRLDTKPPSSLQHSWKGRRKGGTGEEQQGRQILEILFE